MKRILIGGTHSGCGKTTVVCALLQALVNRKIKVSSFKCGPDYIDPMFHRSVTGVPAYNLDRFFCDKETVRYLLGKNGGEFAVIEGVMGFYDGKDESSSSAAVSSDTETPAVIVIDCKGMSQSVGAVMKGYLDYRQNNIAGFIFNRLPESLVSQTQKICAEFNTEYLGRLPVSPEIKIGSRHLGLVTADEISDLKKKMSLLADYAEKYFLIDKIIEIADAKELSYKIPGISPISDTPVRIAVTRDRAFCFNYPETTELLETLGCNMVYFSPLTDKKLPDNIHGLIICGGYPELYAEKLSENKEMLSEINNIISRKIPLIAECGGFLYLNEFLADENKKRFKMAGVFKGTAYKTDKLTRFGYSYLTARYDNLLCKKGETLKAHEFHYCDCTELGDGFVSERKNETDICVFSDENTYAGFPHLYLWGNINAAENFVKKCAEYKNNESIK